VIITSRYTYLLLDVMDTEKGWRVSQHLPMRVKETKKITAGNFMDYLRTQEEHIAQYYTQIEFLMVPHEIYATLNRIPVITSILGTDFRVLFYGGVSPSNFGLIAPC
jgi:hypothetical protein